MARSSDPYYRYKMPAIVVKHEGKGKMKKSVLVNIKEVCEKIGRPADYLLTYLGRTLSATAKLERENLALSYVTGHHDLGQVQEQVLQFIKDTVMCHHCDNQCPETSCHVEGSKKNKSIFLRCKGCGEPSYLDSTDRFVRYMIAHPAEDASYGHAAQANTTATSTAAITGKKECPRCHHKTSKSTCSKCGSHVMAADIPIEDTIGQSADADANNEGRKHCPTCHHNTSKPICSKCGTHIGEINSMPSGGMTQDLIATVRPWMAAMEACHDELSLDDFTAHVTTGSSTRSTPLDHLGAVVQVIASNVGNSFTACEPKLQPKQVAQEAEAIVNLWSRLIEQLCLKVGDTCAVVDTVISNVHEGLGVSANGDRVVVGLLLALRDVSCVAGGLLEGCQRLEVQSAAMKKFVEFLEEEEEDEDEEVEVDDSQSAGAEEAQDDGIDHSDN